MRLHRRILLGLFLIALVARSALRFALIQLERCDFCSHAVVNQIAEFGIWPMSIMELAVSIGQKFCFWEKEARYCSEGILPGVSLVSRATEMFQNKWSVPKQLSQKSTKKIIYHPEIESRSVFKRLILQILSTISNGKIIVVEIPIN